MNLETRNKLDGPKDSLARCRNTKQNKQTTINTLANWETNKKLTYKRTNKYTNKQKNKQKNKQNKRTNLNQIVEISCQNKDD